MNRTFKLFFVCLLAFLLASALVFPVFADSEILRPNASGDKTECEQFPPLLGSNYDKVDEASSDGDSTYVQAIVETNAYYMDLYNLPSTAIEEGWDINSITVYASMRKWAIPSSRATSGKIYIKTEGTEYGGTLRALTNSYVEYGDPWTTNPSTGENWTVTELNALQIGVELRAIYAEPNFAVGRCTQIYVTIYYNEVSAETTLNLYSTVTLNLTVQSTTTVSKAPTTLNLFGTATFTFAIASLFVKAVTLNFYGISNLAFAIASTVSFTVTNVMNLFGSASFAFAIASFFSKVVLLNIYGTDNLAFQIISLVIFTTPLHFLNFYGIATFTFYVISHVTGLTFESFFQRFWIYGVTFAFLGFLLFLILLKHRDKEKE